MNETIRCKVDAILNEDYPLANLAGDPDLPAIMAELRTRHLGLKREKEALNKQLQAEQPDYDWLEGMTGERTTELKREMITRQRVEEALGRARSELERRVAELAVLNQIARTMTTVTDLPTALENVVEVITRLFEARRTVIGLLNETQTELTALAHFEQGAEASSSLVGIALPVSGDALIQQALKAGQSIIIPQSQAVSMVRYLYDVIQPQPIYGMVAVPLLAYGQTIGLIEINLDQPDRQLTPTNLKLAETIAGQIGSGIEVTRLFEEERRQRWLAECLREVATVLNSSLAPETVLVKIFEQLGRIIRHDAGDVFLLEGEGLVLSGGIGPAIEAYRGKQISLSGQNPVARVFNSQQPLIINEGARERHWMDWPEVEFIQSWIGVPLVVDQNVIGVLTVDDFSQTQAYQEEDMHTLQIFANQAATAIHNARLYEAIKELHCQTEADAQIKTALLQEVNHRVRNNLMTVSSLLLAEARTAPAEGRAYVEAAMERLNRRIQGLVEVHDLLTETQGLPISLSELTRRLIRVASELLPPERQAVVEVEESSIKIPPRQAYHLALVINELATNTVKYSDSTIHIRINFDREGNIIRLEYRDNGPGYPAELLQLENYNLPLSDQKDKLVSERGLYLIWQMVTMVLQGRLSLANDQGAVTRIEFKEEPFISPSVV